MHPQGHRLPSDVGVCSVNKRSNVFGERRAGSAGGFTAGPPHPSYAALSHPSPRGTGSRLPQSSAREILLCGKPLSEEACLYRMPLTPAHNPSRGPVLSSPTLAFSDRCHPSRPKLWPWWPRPTSCHSWSCRSCCSCPKGQSPALTFRPCAELGRSLSRSVPYRTSQAWACLGVDGAELRTSQENQMCAGAAVGREGAQGNRQGTAAGQEGGVALSALSVSRDFRTSAPESQQEEWGRERKAPSHPRLPSATRSLCCLGHLFSSF